MKPLVPTSIEARALKLIALIELQPMNAAQICQATGWSRGQFAGALAHARSELCPVLDVAIPHPVPDDGFCYRVTGEWLATDDTPAIASGCSHALGIVETRLRSVLRDVKVARSGLDSRSSDGRKANFLMKHLTHILAVMAEIDQPTEVTNGKR